MSIEELMARMTAIMNAANGRDLTDDEVAEYETLEKDLQARQRTENITARHKAYNVVVNPAGVPTRSAKADDGRTDQDRAFENYLRTGQGSPELANLQISNAQGSGSTAGGYTIPSGFRQKLVEVRKAFGGFAPEAENITTSEGGPLEYPTLNDTANVGEITAESAAFSNGADMVFGTVALGAYKYTSSGASNLPLRVPVELLQDSAFDIEGLVARKLGERIARLQATHWVTGSGSGQPKGILSSTLTSDRDLDTADTPDYADLVGLTDLLDEEYEGNAKWLMRKNTWSQLRQVVDLNGRPIVQDSTDGISQLPQRMLLGKPVIIDQAAPLLSSAADTYPIAYGDFREAYVIRRVSNLVVVVNPYSRANYGEVEFTAWERADGTVQNRSAYVIMQNNT